MIINHLLFADDAVVFAPSAKGLQQLLDLCSNFAISHNVVFNSSKSQCLIVNSKYVLISHPSFHLSGVSLPYTDCYKYLGQLINSSLSDDADIMRQTRSLYARSNMIIRKFTSASLSTKTKLFNAFCTPIYGCALWCSMYQYSYRKLNIAYDDAFRQLLQEPRWCSASQLIVNNNVSLFAANIRELVYSLWRSLNASNNVLVSTALRSDLLVSSPVFRRWHNILF